MKKKGILITSAIFILVIALVIVYLKSCAYLPIKGTVIDAESGQPIEGAVILAEWTVKSWFPDGPTKTIKAVETFTDKNGRFKLNVYILRPVSNSYLTIYKAGYVCWNNKYIFPDNARRYDFEWESNREYALERFKKEYTYSDHVSFIRTCIPSLSASDPFSKAYRWEELMEYKELRGNK